MKRPGKVSRLAREVLRRPALLLWCAFILFIPLYVFDSGLPQPGDFLLLLLIPIALTGWNGKLSPIALRPFRALAVFTIWVVLVNYSWAFILGNWGLFGADTFVLFPLYYVYNAMVFLVALVMYQRFGERFLRITLYLVFAAVLFQSAASFVVNRGHLRGAVFFNNPNQLGYYALLAACIIALSQRQLRVGLVTASVGLTGCIYLALLSASKAAVGGTLILLLLTIVSNPRIIVAAVIVVVGLLAVGGPVATAIDATETRWNENRYPQYSFFEQRGYDRIWSHSEYVVLGAGEGGTDRFADTTVIGRHEIHSSAGTILFSYGIVGVIMFLVFVWRVLQGASLRSALMLVPPLAYTVAHQGLRFTMLWVLLVIFTALKQHERTAPSPAR